MTFSAEAVHVPYIFSQSNDQSPVTCSGAEAFRGLGQLSGNPQSFFYHML